MAENNEGKTVTLPESEIAAILAQNAELASQVRHLITQGTDQSEDKGLLRAKPVAKSTVTIMFIDEKPVVGIQNQGTELNPVKLVEVPDPLDKAKRIFRANLIVRDPKTEKLETISNIDFMDFVQEGERRECDVLKNRDERWVINQGMVQKKEVKGYRMVELDVEVPALIEGTERYFIVDIDGKGVEVHEDYVNMAKSTPRAKKEYVGSAE